MELKSWIERRQGDFPAYLKSKREALRLDPRNVSRTNDLLLALITMHRYDEAWLENESSPLDSFIIGETRNFLLFREHRNFERLQESMRDLCTFYERTDCGWSAHIANRDYQGALNSLDQKEQGSDEPTFSASDRRRIFTYWLMEDDKLLAQGLPVWQDLLEADRSESGAFYRSHSYVGMALLLGSQGQVRESERLITRWSLREPIDWAERMNVRNEACRVLGMIAAAHAAVKCLIAGLSEPSTVTPFLEPYLPFYDSLRDEPEFIELLTDIDRDYYASKIGAGSEKK